MTIKSSKDILNRNKRKVLKEIAFTKIEINLTLKEMIIYYSNLDVIFQIFTGKTILENLLKLLEIIAYLFK